MNFTATGPSPLLARIASGDVESLIAGCRALDVRLWVEDGRLRFDAPRGGLDPVIRAALVANKAELIGLLTRPGKTGETSPWLFRSAELQAEFSAAIRSPLTADEIAECDQLAREQMETTQ